MIKLDHTRLTPDRLERARKYGRMARWTYMIGPCVQDPMAFFKHHIYSWVRLGAHVFELYITLSPQAPQ